MNQQNPKGSPKRNSTKNLLTTLKLTTTVGAVSLTLAGWGLLSAAEAINAAALPPTTAFVSAAPSLSAPVRANATAFSAPRVAAQNTTQSAMKPLEIAPTAGAQSNAGASVVVDAQSTATATATTVATAATATPEPTVTPDPTATPAVLFKLDVVQWLQTQAGDPVAVVRDNNGTLWYVWGTDVPLIEQGLQPTVQPQPVNSRGRGRGS